jgi:hypothetical protein
VIIDDHDVLVCPALHNRIFSVPNWHRQQQARHGMDDKTHISSYGNASYLFTQYDKSKLTIRHHSATGIPVFRARTPHSKTEYASFQTCFPCYNSPINDEAENTAYSSVPPRRSQRQRVPGKPIPASFTTPAAPANHTSPDTPDTKATALLMAHHLKFGHLPFDRLQEAAKQGLLPIHIAHCTIPKCAGCLFGKAKRQPWCTAHQQGHLPKKNLKPGDVVSVDQLISKTPGLVAQTTGNLMNKRHFVATIFVDHASGLDYVHTQDPPPPTTPLRPRRPLSALPIATMSK